MAKCSVCKIRDAVFYKKDSGEVVCKRCLERGIVKKVKRAIARNSMLKLKDKITFIVLPWKPYTSIAALKILEIIERKFLTNIIAYATKENVDFKEAEKLFNVEFVEFDFNISKELTFKEAERVLVGKLTSIVDRDSKIVLPYTLEDQALQFLYGLLKIDLEIIAFSKPTYIGRNFIIKPFYQVPCEELQMYSYIKKLRRTVVGVMTIKWDPILSHVSKLLEHMMRHYELAYSTVSMAHNMANKVSLNSCRLCGLPALNTFCEVHLSFKSI